jgi:nucleotide-binding universal stress UspA family protein
MQLYKKILVAVDCSAVDDVIIEHISALAIQNKAQVYLIHVVHSHTLDQERVLHKAAKECLESHGHSFIGDILFGSVSRTLKHKISTPLLLIGHRR